MRILLLRPPSPNERFGLGPFFRVEPLGLAYVAQALLDQGHNVKLADLRFGPPLHELLRSHRSSLVGIACSHTVDIPSALACAKAVKRYDPGLITLLGGHAASVFPTPLWDESVDAIAVDDGERSVPAVALALMTGQPLKSVPGLWVRPCGHRQGEPFEATPKPDDKVCLDLVARPARHLIAPYQEQYLCVHKTPLWAVETARGCPYRCSFCSIWRHNDRRYRMRSIGAVCDDLEDCGQNIFVVDDLFWYPPERSRELAKELLRRGVRKDWVLVQSRLDTVARHPELLELWRPLAEHFDIFFGFEAPTQSELEKLSKDMKLSDAAQGIETARRFGYGVTGNFVIDPDWDEPQFEALWAMVDRLGLNRSGYTILTPLPGTPLFDAMQSRIVERDWSRYDMHHLLYEPRLGRQRFFELFVQCWKRNVLSSGQSKGKLWGWLKGLTPRQALMLGHVLLQTQRLLRPEAYLKETFPMQVPAALR